MAAQLAIYGSIAALQLAGGYFSSQNIRETAALNQDIADMNAEFAELDAYDAEVEGYTQAVKYQSIIDQTLSEQQAALTAADIDVTYGSVATIREESQFIADINKMEIEKNAQERALGYTRQARDYRFRSDLEAAQSEARASQALFQSVLGATQTGVTGYARSK